MKKNLKWVDYRHPRTRAEARANQEGWERPRRRPRNLPNSYDDRYPQADRKSWKAKRKTQYHPGGRGKEHSITVDADFTYEWDLTVYFKEHGIPYRIECVSESRMRKFKKWKRVKTGWRHPIYHTRYTKKDGIPQIVRIVLRYEDEWTWEQDGWEWKPVTDVVAYKIIWWYDKDIGIDHILKQCRRRRLYMFQ